MKQTSDIIIHRFPGHKSLGMLYYRGWYCMCALGRGGLALKHREGDGITPVGRYALRRVHIRADRLPFYKARLPQRAINPTDWWCDAPNSRHYNRLMHRIPAPDGHDERLWRADDLYDLIVEIGYNDAPTVKNEGSAIFIHIAREGMTPTAGCVALRRRDMLHLVRQLRKDTKIILK